MTGYDLLLFAVVLFCACSLALFVLRLSRFPERTIRDVRRFLRPVDSAIMLRLLDPLNEAQFGRNLTERSLRWEQMRNLHYAREYMARMSHNAAILAEWANSELSLQMVGRPGDGEESEYLRSARKLQVAASEFRFYALVSLWKIRLWMLLRALPWVPLSSAGVLQLRGVYGPQFMSLYAKLTEAVSELGVLYGREFHEELLNVL
jgi:hypothetical protein